MQIGRKMQFKLKIRAHFGKNSLPLCHNAAAAAAACPRMADLKQTHVN
jgi:hypothetical protein